MGSFFLHLFTDPSRFSPWRRCLETPTGIQVFDLAFLRKADDIKRFYPAFTMTLRCFPSAENENRLSSAAIAGLSFFYYIMRIPFGFCPSARLPRRLQIR